MLDRKPHLITLLVLILALGATTLYGAEDEESSIFEYLPIAIGVIIYFWSKKKKSREKTPGKMTQTRKIKKYVSPQDTKVPIPRYDRPYDLIEPK